jgi:hypothetical protein
MPLPEGDRYEVRSRLESRPSLRGVLASLLVVAVVGLWAATTLTSPRSEPRHSDPSAAPDGSKPLDGRTPGFPPEVERAPEMRYEIIPTLSFTGPEWIDTTRPQDRMTASVGVAEWAFVWADGTAACICFQPSETSASEERHIAWFGPDGEPTANETLGDWPAVGKTRVITAVAWDPTAAAFYLAWADLLPGGWTVRLELRDAMGGVHTSSVMARNVFADAPLGASVSIDVTIAPDGRHARVELALAPFAPPTSTVKRWTVPINGATFGSPSAAPAPSDADGACASVGWATGDHYLELCNRDAPPGDVGTVLVREGRDGRRDRLEIEGTGPLDWMIDQTRGRLFLYRPSEDRLFRVDIAQLALASGSFDDPAPGETFQPAAPWPSEGGEQTAWWPRGAGGFGDAFQGARGVQPRTLVGSRDGRVLYAIGFFPDSRSVGAARSSGIWAFDADTLAVVGHWGPAGDYDAVALTPDGAYVIGLGSPLQAESLGSHGRTIAFHDARTGQLGLVLRGDTSGVAFLVPEPFP